MALEVWAFDATITAGTPKATPASVSLAMPARKVTEVQILIPPGPRGEVGFALGSSGFAVLPQSRGAFIVTDNEVIKWPLEQAIESGAWTLFGYNTGTYDHTLRVRFLVDSIQQAVGPGSAFLIPNDRLGLSSEQLRAAVPGLVIPGVPPAPELPPLRSIFNPFG